MYIKSLELSNFRCLNLNKYSFSKETFIQGLNGSGKSSIIEALYLLFTLRGIKKQPLTSMVAYGADFLRIFATLDDDTEITLKYDGTKRNLLINDNEIESLPKYLYSFPIAMHSPEYSGFLSQQQSDRRAFLDRLIFYTDIDHLNDIKLYNRIIQQKNIELDKFSPDKLYIDVLNESIVSLSSAISKRRFTFISMLNNNLKQLYSDASFDFERVFISYSTNISNTSLLSSTSYGTHRDRISLVVDEKLVEKFSSYGQKKSFSFLSLLSAIMLVEKIRKFSIIVCLDDFEVGLDLNRAKYFRNLFSNGRQAIYTGVDDCRLGFKDGILDLLLAGPD